MQTASPTLYASRLTDIVCRSIRALLPQQTASGAFLADSSRTDPLPATPQDITLNRAIYALAQLPEVDDPFNPFFDDRELRERAIRVGAYLYEAVGETGGVLLAGDKTGVHISGLHSMNFWTCPHAVRCWIAALVTLEPHLTPAQRSQWRQGLMRCLELLAGRHETVADWPGLQAADGPRLSAAAAAGAALWFGGLVLAHEPFRDEGRHLWELLCARIAQSGSETPVVDGMDIDALLALINGLPETPPLVAASEIRLAGWRARLTMANGGINELFDRHRNYSRFGMGGSAPALLRQGHTVPAAAILDSYERRPRRSAQALPELATLVESVESLRATLPLAPGPHLSESEAGQRLQAQYFGWFGGETSRAWLFRGNSWTAGCRAPAVTAGGFSCPWSVRHLRTPLWIDGSAPDPRRLLRLNSHLASQPAPDSPRRTLALQGEQFLAHFGLGVIDEQTLQLSARVRWNRPDPERDPAGVQLLLERNEGDRQVCRLATGEVSEFALALGSLQRELPSGAQLELQPRVSGEPACLLAVHATGPTPLIRWNLPPRKGSVRLPLPSRRLELFFPLTPQQETRIDLVLTVPRQSITRVIV